MIHLRIADKLLDAFPNLKPEEFIMGNLAPDSGEPSGDGTHFVPSKDISHFRFKDERGKKCICADKFADEYFTKEKITSYTPKQYSFYMGYLVHLITDVMWVEKVLKTNLASQSSERYTDQKDFISLCKEDWYDQDHLFLKKNPLFRSFAICKNIKSFTNTYIDFFPEKAFENRKGYIIEFYSENHPNLDREYKYFTEEQANSFVSESSVEIINWLKDRYL